MPTSNDNNDTKSNQFKDLTEGQSNSKDIGVGQESNTKIHSNNDDNINAEEDLNVSTTKKSREASVKLSEEIRQDVALNLPVEDSVDSDSEGNANDLTTRQPSTNTKVDDSAPKPNDGINQFIEEISDLMSSLNGLHTMFRNKIYQKSPYIRRSIAKCNMNRNRYTDISPSDEGRVCLEHPGLENNDYVNASYCRIQPNPSSTDAYTFILSQGPIEETVDHFWQMIFERRVRHVIMLTRMLEGRSLKCFRYWPGQNQSLHIPLLSPKESLSTAKPYPALNLIVKHVETKVVQDVLIQNDFVLTCVPLHSTTSASFDHYPIKEPLNVRQYQYLKWGDHSTPDKAEFNQFLFYTLDNERVFDTTRNASAQTTGHSSTASSAKRSFSGSPPQFNGLPVVHCSAGVGRSGVYGLVAAFVAMMDTNATTANGANSISTAPFSFVTLQRVTAGVLSMRATRPHVVQTPEQFAFACEAIAAAAWFVRRPVERRRLVDELREAMKAGDDPDALGLLADRVVARVPTVSVKDEDGEKGISEGGGVGKSDERKRRYDSMEVTPIDHTQSTSKKSPCADEQLSQKDVGASGTPRMMVPSSGGRDASANNSNLAGCQDAASTETGGDGDGQQVQQRERELAELQRKRAARQEELAARVQRMRRRQQLEFDEAAAGGGPNGLSRWPLLGTAWPWLRRLSVDFKRTMGRGRNNTLFVGGASLALVASGLYYYAYVRGGGTGAAVQQ